MEHNFKKKFGQNFLSDINLLQAIVKDADITNNDNVLEIGAGAGALTKQLASQANKVIAYEIDTDLCEHLKGLQLSNVEFVFKDALKEKIEDIEEKLENEYKLVANLPYYITTPLIFKFLEESSKVKSLTIMVQKEVAERIVAKEGGKDYGVLTVMVAFFGEAKITRVVGRQMFYPQPNVDSCVVNICLNKRFPEVDKKDFYNFIRACFSMRRKTILNNLNSGLKISKTEILDKLKDFDLSRRAESFSLEEFVQMFNKIK